jgi:hypothetical protein
LNNQPNREFNTKRKRIPEDEDIVSEEEEVDMNYDDEEDFNNDIEQEQFEEDEEIQMEGLDENQTELSKLDREIKLMEKKLGLNNERKKQQYKKRLTQENHDADILDFLDHIDNIVKDEKKTKPTKSNTPTIKKNLKKEKETNEKIENDLQTKQEDTLDCKFSII